MDQIICYYSLGPLDRLSLKKGPQLEKYLISIFKKLQRPLSFPSSSLFSLHFLDHQSDERVEEICQRETRVVEEERRPRIVAAGVCSRCETAKKQCFRVNETVQTRYYLCHGLSHSFSSSSRAFPTSHNTTVRSTSRFHRNNINNLLSVSLPLHTLLFPVFWLFPGFRSKENGEFCGTQ